MLLSSICGRSLTSPGSFASLPTIRIHSTWRRETGKRSIETGEALRSIHFRTVKGAKRESVSRSISRTGNSSCLSSVATRSGSSSLQHRNRKNRLDSASPVRQRNESGRETSTIARGEHPALLSLPSCSARGNLHCSGNQALLRRGLLTLLGRDLDKPMFLAKRSSQAERSIRRMSLSV